MSSCRRRKGECLGRGPLATGRARSRQVDPGKGRAWRRGSEVRLETRESIHPSYSRDCLTARRSSFSFSSDTDASSPKRQGETQRQAEGTRGARGEGPREGRWTEMRGLPSARRRDQEVPVPVSCLVVDAGGRGRGRRGSSSKGEGGRGNENSLSPPIHPPYPTCPTDHAVYREETKYPSRFFVGEYPKGVKCSGRASVASLRTWDKGGARGRTKT